MKCSECGALSLTEEIEVVPQASVVLVDTEKKKRLPALMLCDKYLFQVLEGATVSPRNLLNSEAFGITYEVETMKITSMK